MAEFPHTPKVKLLVSEVDVPSPCCFCREKEGVLTCSGCKAVTYCGEECQEKGWNDHKKICHEIKQHLQEVNAATEALANEFGGIEALLEDPLVKKGLFKFEDSRLLSANNDRPTIATYDIARWKLINAYGRCGKEAFSKLAFRLAAENFLHMLQLCKDDYVNKARFVITSLYKYCGWMVAGDMDQQYLKFLVCIHSIPDTESGRIKISDINIDVKDEDIEGLSVVSLVNEEMIHDLKRFKFHDFMLISLIKYKKIKALRMQKEGSNTFLEGTQSRSGEKTIDERIDSLSNQVNDLLIEVNEDNPVLIRGVLETDEYKNESVNSEIDEMRKEINIDVESHRNLYDNMDPSFLAIIKDPSFLAIIKDPSFLGITNGVELKGLEDMISEKKQGDVNITLYANRKYGYAWHMDSDSTTALRHFLQTGNVMEEGEDTTSPQTEMGGREKCLFRLIMELGKKYKDEGNAEDLGKLIKKIRPFTKLISKAKAAKLVRGLIDIYLDMEADTGYEVQLCKECIQWATDEKRTFLRQTLEARLIGLYSDTERYTDSLALISQLLGELKKLEDKNLLVEVQLLESKTYACLSNLPKARAALISARTTANSIYVPPRIQAQLDLQAGILHASEEKDFKTAFSYFFEAFEQYDSIEDPKAILALKYMLLSKVMLNLPDEVSNIVSGKLALRYSGPEVEAVKAVAAANKARSLADFQTAVDKFKSELQDDKIVAKHLDILYQSMLEQNLCKIIEPYSKVQVDYVAFKIGLPRYQVEKKLSQMILDKKFLGVLDQETGVLIVFTSSSRDKTSDDVIETISAMNNVVDRLYQAAKKLT